jgi:hypothetical protein
MKIFHRWTTCRALDAGRADKGKRRAPVRGACCRPVLQVKAQPVSIGAQGATMFTFRAKTAATGSTSLQSHRR